MDKKYLNAILLFLLIIIWGSVIYKYFGKENGNPKPIEFVDTSILPINNSTMTKDTFQLKLINTNPFKVSKRKKTTTVKNNTKPKNKKPVTKPNIKWPTITYHGFVKGDNKATRLILLKINNRLYRKREKETVDDVTLQKAYSDSLIIMFNNTNKTIKKIHD